MTKPHINIKEKDLLERVSILESMLKELKNPKKTIC